MIDYKIKYIYLKNLYNKLKQNKQKFIGGMEDNSESSIKTIEDGIIKDIYKILRDINQTRIETYEEFISFIDNILTRLNSSVSHFYSYIGDQIKYMIDFINDILNEYRTELNIVFDTATETIIKQFETMKNKLNIIGEKKEVKLLDTKPSSENDDKNANPDANPFPLIEEDDIYGTPFAHEEDDIYGTLFARKEDETSSDDNLAPGPPPWEQQEEAAAAAVAPPAPHALPALGPPPWEQQLQAAAEEASVEEASPAETDSDNENQLDAYPNLYLNHPFALAQDLNLDSDSQESSDEETSSVYSSNNTSLTNTPEQEKASPAQEEAPPALYIEKPLIPVGQPIDQPVGQPVDQPVGQPVEQPVDQPEGEDEGEGNTSHTGGYLNSEFTFVYE